MQKIIRIRLHETMTVSAVQFTHTSKKHFDYLFNAGNNWKKSKTYFDLHILNFVPTAVSFKSK